MMRCTNCFQIVFHAACIVFGLSATVSAVPYASGVQNTGGNLWEFVLNQDADAVTITRDGGNAIVMNNLTKGTYSFDMDVYSDFEIAVANSSAPGWAQISDDTLAQSEYYSPRGVAVNRNSTSSNFGRIYVSEGLGGVTAAGARFTSDGIYVMGADQSDILSQGEFAAHGNADWYRSANSPFKITIAPDDSVYIADWSDEHSGVWRAPADLGGTWPNILNNDFQDGEGLNANHGSIPSVWVEGTGADTKLYTLDEDFDLGGTRGSILRYDIGAATDYTGIPVEQTQDSTDVILNGLEDFVRDEDGSWWVTQYRWADAAAVPALTHFEDGGTEPVYNSGAPEDIVLDRAYGSIDIHNELDLLVIGRIPLSDPIDGVFVLDISDPDNPTLLDTIPYSGRVRDVAFDAAGNIYAVNNITETLRIFSRGGDSVATTTSAGEFTMMSPDPFDEADFNEDGSVDGDDFLLWQGGFGQFNGDATKIDGDANGDGFVDGNDFLVWQNQFGNSDGAGNSAVPEPASVVLIVAGALGLLAWRRR